MLQKVEAQVRAACLGVAQDVKDLQTKTGVKDAFTQYWINELIAKARSTHKLQPNQPAHEIQAELMAWVESHKKSVYNPFLMMPGAQAYITIKYTSVLMC